MARPKKVVEEEKILTPEIPIPMEVAPKVKSEKELLIECYEFMKSRGINGISDIEVKINRAE